jgi:hypothetical protein
METIEVKLLKEEVRILRKYKKYARRLSKFMSYLSRSPVESVSSQASRNIEIYYDIREEEKYFTETIDTIKELGLDSLLE